MEDEESYRTSDRPAQDGEPRRRVPEHEGTPLLCMKEGSHGVWTYSGHGTPGALRLLSVEKPLSGNETPSIDLYEWEKTMLPWPRDGKWKPPAGEYPPGMPGYAAISHTWGQSEDVVRRGKEANRPLLIETGLLKPHEISWLGLVQAATAAKELKCEYLWLDLLSLDQLSKEDKKLQIGNMHNIYSNATAVVVMLGGVSVAQKLDEVSTWINRAWTLQEATLCAHCWCLLDWKVDVQNVSASDRDFQKLDGGIAIVDMASLLRYSPGQHIHLGGAVDKNGEGKIDLNLQVHCWGRDPAVVGALSDAINTMRPEESGGADSDDGDDDQELSKYDNDGITFLIGDDDVGEVRPRVNPWEKENNGAAERHCAAWRSMWLRTSTKPQDMVFSTMHLLGANLEVNYKRELEDIVFELIGNIPSSRGWLSMGYDIPVMPSSGLIPMLPKFTAQSEPTYSVDGEVRLASSMVSYDFVCTYFDMEIKSTDKENGHVICARMLDVKHSSVPEKWVQSSEYDYRSYLRLSNPGQDINTGCRFKGRIGNIVVIVGKRQSDNEPFVYLLGKDKRGVYQKTGAGTLEETLFLWPDDLNNMEWRHLRVGGGPGAKLAPCNCGKVNSTNKYNPHFSNQDELDTALLHAWQSESRLRLLLGMGANINAQMEGDTTALQEACLFGGNERVVELMLEGGADICAQGGVFGNALNAASYGGYDQVVRMLIEKGADIDAAHEHYGYPLQIAAKENNDAVVKVLLELRAHVNSRGRPGEDALTAAASRGHQAVVEILLKHGADMNGRGENHSYPLTAAMANGHLGVVQTLLQNGAYVNIWGGKLPTPLMAAALQGSVEGIRLLMSHGANVDAKGFAEVHNEGGPHVVTALQSACYKDNFDAVRLLLGFGADVNTRGGSYGTAVGVAAHFGHTEIVRLLIESGAEIEAIGGDFGSALQAAAPETYGDEMLHYNEDVMLLLLGYGADVNAQGGIYGTALQAAVSDLYQKAKERAVRELIKRGADVNAKGGKFGTALQAAIHSYTGNMIQLLIKNGADATKLDNDHLEKLQRACYTGNHLGKVQQLVREGSAVNAITGRYHGTALQAASCNDFVATVKILGSGCRRILRDVPSADDHLQIVQELVENGAVVNVQAGYYGNALQAASCNGYAKVVRYLLRKGANVNARGGRYGNALQAAARHGHKSIVEQLIRAGANVNAGVDRRGYSTIGLHGNALLAGVLNGSEMVELLLSKGARIDGVDDQRRNALHIAAAQGNCDLIDFLLSHGVDVSHCDLQGRSILHHAASSGSVKVVQHLLALRVRTNISDDDGWNALHWAARKGTMAVVRQLIEAGVDRTAKSLEGWTPLRVAIYHKNLSLAALLAVPPRLSHSTPHKSKIRQLDLGTPIKQALAENLNGEFIRSPRAGRFVGFQHHGITCDGCQFFIFGPRYSCQQCEIFNCCFKCIRPMMETHINRYPGHSFTGFSEDDHDGSGYDDAAEYRVVYRSCVHKVDKLARRQRARHREDLFGYSSAPPQINRQAYRFGDSVVYLDGDLLSDAPPRQATGGLRHDC